MQAKSLTQFLCLRGMSLQLRNYILPSAIGSTDARISLSQAGFFFASYKHQLCFTWTQKGVKRNQAVRTRSKRSKELGLAVTQPGAVSKIKHRVYLIRMPGPQPQDRELTSLTTAPATASLTRVGSAQHHLAGTTSCQFKVCSGKVMAAGI